jgi:hypothetical protein
MIALLVFLSVVTLRLLAAYVILGRFGGFMCQTTHEPRGIEVGFAYALPEKIW